MFFFWMGRKFTRFEYIIIQEEKNPIELRRGIINKNKLVKLIYDYGSQKVKNYLTHGYNTFCKYEKKSKNELLV